MKPVTPSIRLATLVIFCAIVGVALAVRFFRLADHPAGFFADEASIGYNAWKILTTGKDEYGVSFPFFFRSFGDYRNPFPIYANIPMVAAFGLTEFAVRGTAAAAGTLTVVLVFFICLMSGIASDLKKGLLFALTTMFFLALSPWHIHFSRFGSEYIYFPFLLSASLLVFLVGLKNPRLLPVAGLLFGATLYTYYPTWMVTPLFVATLSICYGRVLWRLKPYAFFFFLTFAISSTPLIIGITKGIALTRWKNVAITKETTVPLPLFFVQNYIRHFSPTFLFTKGDIDYPGHFIRRFSSRGAAELYLIQAPFVLLGLITILREKKPFHFVILGLLLLYPLGSSFAATDGGAPLAFRSIIGVLPFQFLSGFGIVFLWDILKNRRLAFIMIIIVIITSLFYFYKYIQEYHKEYNLYSSDFWGWQYGPRNVMGYFLDKLKSYDQLYLMGDFNSPEIFIKFYDPTNLCQNRCMVGGFDRFNEMKKQLFAIGVNRVAELPVGLTADTKKIIYYPNGQPAFLVAELKRSSLPHLR